jgi:hypothetical protein
MAKMVISDTNLGDGMTGVSAESLPLLQRRAAEIVRDALRAAK